MGRKKSKLVNGVGLNDATHPIVHHISGKRVWRCPIYHRWEEMLKRCYSPVEQQRLPTYRGCSVAEEWLRFSSFHSWVLEQDWVGKDLDKDILFPGNRVYGPDTCVFINHATNLLLADSAGSRGDYPIGVSWHKQRQRYHARVNTGGKNKSLGLFNTAAEAHGAWQVAKADQIDFVAGAESDERVAAALRVRADALRFDYLEGVESKGLGAGSLLYPTHMRLRNAKA